MKKLEFRKLIFIFIFILCLNKTNENFCTQASCNMNGIDYSIEAILYTDGNGVRSKFNSYNDDIIQCYECPGISPSSFYFIREDGSCLITECDGGKIIEKTNECVYKSISDLFSLGDFYYCYEPLNAICIDKNCECQSYFYIEYISGTKKKYHCLDSTSLISSDYKFYNYKTKELYLYKCPDNFRYMKLRYIYPDISRCSDSCETSEYIISVLDTNNLIMNEYCVDNCTDITNAPNIDSSLTNYKFEYINNNVKHCLKKCPSGTFEKTYIEQNAPNKFACVPPEECTFYDRDLPSCLNSCDQSDNKKYHKYGSNECISACPIEEYKYEYENGNDKICYKIDNCAFVLETDTFKECIFSSCSESKQYPNQYLYHNINSKFCLKQCTLPNRYYAEDKKICYSSCSEIPEDYKYEENDYRNIELDNQNPKKCYKTMSDTNCEAYYKKPNGIFKCMKKSDCFDLNLKYFLGSECKDNCYGFYQIELEENLNKYIKCFETLDDALKDDIVKFCDISQKKCWKEFPNDDTYYINSIFGNPNTKYELVKNCPNYYYKRDDSNNIDNNILNKFWCTDNCKDKNKFFYRNNKQCFDSCIEIFKYYFDESNNECLDSCELRPDKKFSFKSLGTNQEKCLSSCDSNSVGTRGYYHNYDSNFCLLECNADYSGYIYYMYSSNTNDENNFICYPSCLRIPGGEYKYASRVDGQNMYF